VHKLDRTSVAGPACLVAPPPGYRYDNLKAAEKAEIRARLLELQRQRCAYCERRTGEDRDDGHIEHFRNQANHAYLELAWSNMFWSCNDEKTCGKYKDKCDRLAGPRSAFDHTDIIDPSAEDPGELLLFVVDGTLRGLDGLDAGKQRRVAETLRVFHLDSPYLRKSREDAVAPYLSALKVLVSAAPELVVDYVISELQRVEMLPFCTSIQQYLEGFIP
jgi:uncharacterized protein (TIGR02646 family)